MMSADTLFPFFTIFLSEYFIFCISSRRCVAFSTLLQWFKENATWQQIQRLSL